jgi:glycosyltransferase involved in cell wall biosynthesis
VLFLIYGLAPAGPERRILEFARAFPDRGEPLDVHVCVIGDDMTLLDEFQQTRARVVHIRIRRPYLEWGNVRRVLDYIDEHDIRVVNSFNLQTLLVGAAAKLRFGARVKLVHHLISLWEDLSPTQRRITWGAMRFADRIVCNGRVVRDELIGSRAVAAPVSVIPNGVDDDYFRPRQDARAAARARLGLSDQHIVLGTVGHVRPVKNYPFLLSAMRRLLEIVPHARLVAVGGGAQLEEMKALARSLDLGERVVFTGMQSDVRPFLSAMDVFVLCSLREGNPNVVLQAMAMALPVVSVKVGEVPFVIEQESSGFVVDHDERAFVAAVVRLAADRQLRRTIGAAARQRVSGIFSATLMIDAYAALMQQAVVEPEPAQTAVA